MKRLTATFLVSAILTSNCYAADLDSVIRAIEASSNLVNPGANILEKGAAIGKVSTQVHTGNLTQIQVGGTHNTQEMNMGSVINGKVLGVFDANVTTKNVLQSQNSTQSRQSMNLGVLR